jgi:serine/threonine protein kinase
MVHNFRYEDRPVAIKVLIPERTKEATPECKEKFQREVNLLSKIEHNNVIKVFFK